jgi:hypothetical protein
MLALLLAGLIVTCLQLVSENRALGAALALASGRRAVEVGDRLERVVGVDLAGSLRELPLVDSGHHLLILFSANCAFCLESFDHYRALESLARPGTTVVWLVRDEPETARDFLGQNHVTGAVLMSPTYNTYRSTGLSFVPQLVAVDATGVVQRVWHGAPTDEGWEAIRDYVTRIEPSAEE